MRALYIAAGLWVSNALTPPGDSQAAVTFAAISLACLLLIATRRHAAR